MKIGGSTMEIIRRQEEEMADRLLDSQISDYQEEQWERKHAARWPTAMEYGEYMDRIGPPPETP